MSDKDPRQNPDSGNKEAKKNVKEEEHVLKQNPNPAANGNVPEEDKKQRDSSAGVGSEITDGEAG